ncbi:Threonylcarbamoyl-AMP synthase-like protein [Drosera capensis]
MKSAVRIGDKLLHHHPQLPHPTPPGPIPSSQPHSNRIGVVWGKRMGSSMAVRCGGVKGVGVGVVRPAAVEYAAEAVEAIRSGKVIAVPTDTLYGFAFADNLPVGLLDALLPGPVTVVLAQGESSILERSLNPGLGSIGVRIPENDLIIEICRGFVSALALTSVNLSGHTSSVCIKDFESLWEHCAYVFYGGQLPRGRAGSTIVDLTKFGKYKIIRSGSAQEETIAILERHSLQNEAASTPARLLVSANTHSCCMVLKAVPINQEL